MAFFQERISEYVWDVKYRYRFGDEIKDHSIETTWARVAKAVAEAEAPEQQSTYQQQFYDILHDFQFLPGGRILAGAGTHLDVTLFNCFVMPILTDSLSSIFDALKEGALTLQQGGGVGYDFSTLRPRGFLIHHTGAYASGPVSFMRIWNAMCATMLSTGTRRGAMMSILRCDHPDIEEFIAAKADPRELRHFNVSVLISNDFMKAVEENKNWELVFPLHHPATGETVLRHWSGSAERIACQVVKKINARELWQKIIKSAYDYAEPGVVFEDTINAQNNLWYREWISATNPCGEIPLPAYGACNLGAINLTQCIDFPFEANASVNWQKLIKISAMATRFLDNVIDISHFPLEKQKQEALTTRRIGLGLTGLADAFVMLGVRYGSEASFALAGRLMKTIADTTWQTSIELAKERGPFPLFDREKYLAGQFVQQLSPELRRGIDNNGIRNSHHNTIAPAGTISLLANNISNGLEPIFSPFYERTVRTITGELKKFKVTDYVVRRWQEKQKDNTLPPAWIDTQSLTPDEHLHIQAAIQPYVDNAISKTINIPVDFPFTALMDVYSNAYRLGLKGCTVYRPNEVTGSVLSLLNVDSCGGCVD